MRPIACFLLIALLFCGTACADMENHVPVVGDVIGEFTVTKAEPFDVYGGTLITLTHEKSGGQVLWMANDDEERSFVIGFRTHYEKDTGVPHVFEHAALSGSDKYPDSGLFFSMTSQLYQTYLNASTSVFYTDYEAASLSDRQLLKIADVILSGVFHPLVITDQHAMMREAYRYELTDADSDITLTGTVYSEMQGAYYANITWNTIAKYLFPGSWHATCTGGKPGVIEEMTQQDLADFHATYYQPGNAISILYGDLNLPDYLDLIASYYDEYTPVDVSTEDTGFTPIAGDLRIDLDVPASANESPDTTLVYAIPLRGYSDTDVYMLRTFLTDAVCNTSSSLDRILMDRFPNSSVGLSVLPASLSAEPMLVFELENANNIVPEDFVAAVNEGLAADLAEGIRYDVLETSLKSKRISFLRLRENSHIGIAFSDDLLSAFADTGDPYSYTNQTNALLTDGETWLHSGILESVIEDKLLDPADSRLLVLTKRPGTLEEINAANAQSLADMKAAMSQEEIDVLIESTADYNTWLNDAAANSQIDEVKVLTVSELPDEIKTFTAEEQMLNGVHIVTSDTGNSDLVNIDIYFDASAIPAEDLTRYATMVKMLGALSTEEHDYAEIQRLVNEYGISFSVNTFCADTDRDTYQPVLHVGISCLREELSTALSTAWEILTKTKFDDKDLICYTATFKANSTKTNAAKLAQSFATYYANAITTASGRYYYEVTLVPTLRYMESVSKMDIETFNAETAAWQNILSGLLNRNNLAMTIVSGAEGINDAKVVACSYTDTLPSEERTTADYSVLEPLPQNIAVIIPGSANYNLKQIRADRSGVAYRGKLNAISALVKDRILIPVMRYRNGVYSPLISLNLKYYMVLAYRDPGIAVTYDEVLPSLGGALRGMEITQEELDSYIISAYSTFAMSVGPISGATTAVNDVLCGDESFAFRKAQMESIRTLTPEDLAVCADLFDELSANGCTVTIGSAASIEAEADRFDMVETWFVSSGN